MNRTTSKIAIVGTVGLPPQYGGFETLAANLVEYAQRHSADVQIEVYCSERAYPDRTPTYCGATLHYLPLDANGLASPLYDAWAMLKASLRGASTILVLGVSGTLAIPFLRLFTRARFVVNVDGLEWKRAKWNRLAKAFLRLSEWAAAKFAHEVIADNQAIVDHLRQSYGRDAQMIPYGGDHAGQPVVNQTQQARPEPATAFALMLCRIEPENNIHTILDAFAAYKDRTLLAVGNWNASEYGRSLRALHSGKQNLSISDPVFQRDALYAARAGASVYVHGHSAGGTNPALVEMMWLGIPVLAFDCSYNRHTTENRAHYFKTAADLAGLVKQLKPADLDANALAMHEIARRRYRWDTIGADYFALLQPAEADVER